MLHSIHQLIPASPSRPVKIFITGTDTGVGKTFIASALLRYWKTTGLSVIGMKAICCGGQSDVLLLKQASSLSLSPQLINPIHLPLPRAPIAQDHPSWNIMLKKIRTAVKLVAKFRPDVLLMEGAGGLLCPITQHRTIADLALALGWEVLLIADNRLGALNRILLTIEAAQTRRLKIRGILLNHFGKRPGTIANSNIQVLSRWHPQIPLYSVATKKNHKNVF